VKRSHVQDYADELVPYGGEWMRRVDVIADLKARGLPRRGIDVFLMGADRRKAQMQAGKEQPIQKGSLWVNLHTGTVERVARVEDDTVYLHEPGDSSLWRLSTWPTPWNKQDFLKHWKPKGDDS